MYKETASFGFVTPPFSQRAFCFDEMIEDAPRRTLRGSHPVWTQKNRFNTNRFFIYVPEGYSRFGARLRSTVRWALTDSLRRTPRGYHPDGTTKGSSRGAFILYVPEGILALRRETPSDSPLGTDCLTPMNPPGVIIPMGQEKAPREEPLSYTSQKGFEPLTDGLEGRCSIQLSYWDIKNRSKKYFITLIRVSQ